MSTRERESIEVRHLYDEEYYSGQAAGWEAYAAFDGDPGTMFERARRNFELLDLQPGERFLEIGCGRGEVALAAAVRGCSVQGVDFSPPALAIAQRRAEEISRRRGLSLDVVFRCGPAAEVELPPGSFDAALMAEFIEHVGRAEGRKVLAHVAKALRPGGRLLVYTYPNILQRKVGYPLYRLYVRARRGRWLPAQQDDTLSEHYRDYHLNEQSFFSLRAGLRSAGLVPRIWYDMNPGRAPAGLPQRLLASPPLAHFFATDLVALARKP